MKVVYSLLILLISIPALYGAGEVNPKVFSNVKESLVWLDENIDKGEYEEVYGVLYETTDKKDSFLNYLEYLKKSRGKAKLVDIFKGRVFPSDADSFKLGGHQKELGHVHIDYKKSKDGWHLHRIWMCR